MNVACEGGGPVVALALLSALLFGGGIHLSRIGMRYSDSQTGAMIQIGTGTVMYWLAYPWLAESAYWLSPAVALLAAIGIFRPFVSANLAMAGTRALGPTISSTLSGTAPMFGVAFGVLILGEVLTVGVALGTLAVIAGVGVLSWRGEARRDWALWALALPVGAAFIRSLAQLLAKVGMESIPSPYFVGLVGYTVSFAIALANDRRQRPDRGRVLSPGFKWFAATGAIYGVSILSLNTALGCGDLVVVAPIVACAPVFTLVLGLVLFDESALDRRVVAGVLLVVSGVITITLRG